MAGTPTPHRTLPVDLLHGDRSTVSVTLVRRRPVDSHDLVRIDIWDAVLHLADGDEQTIVKRVRRSRTDSLAEHEDQILRHIEERRAAGDPLDNVIEVLAVGDDGTDFFFVMRRAATDCLQREVRDRDRPGYARSVLVGMLRGLLQLTAIGVVRRDLHPGNVLLLHQGTGAVRPEDVVLIDFGNAYRLGRIPRTPGTGHGIDLVQSFEVLRDRHRRFLPVDDAYSAAVVAYLLLTPAHTGTPVLPVRTRTGEVLRYEEGEVARMQDLGSLVAPDLGALEQRTPVGRALHAVHPELAVAITALLEPTAAARIARLPEIGELLDLPDLPALAGPVGLRADLPPVRGQRSEPAPEGRAEPDGLDGVLDDRLWDLPEPAEEPVELPYYLATLADFRPRGAAQPAEAGTATARADGPRTEPRVPGGSVRTTQTPADNPRLAAERVGVLDDRAVPDLASGTGTRTAARSPFARVRSPLLAVLLAVVVSLAAMGLAVAGVLALPSVYARVSPGIAWDFAGWQPWPQAAGAALVVLAVLGLGAMVLAWLAKGRGAVAGAAVLTCAMVLAVLGLGLSLPRWEAAPAATTVAASSVTALPTRCSGDVATFNVATDLACWHVDGWTERTSTAVADGGFAATMGWPDVAAGGGQGSTWAALSDDTDTCQQVYAEVSQNPLAVWAPVDGTGTTTVELDERVERGQQVRRAFGDQVYLVHGSFDGSGDGVVAYRRVVVALDGSGTAELAAPRSPQTSVVVWVVRDSCDPAGADDADLRVADLLAGLTVTDLSRLDQSYARSVAGDRFALTDLSVPVGTDVEPALLPVGYDLTARGTLAGAGVILAHDDTSTRSALWITVQVADGDVVPAEATTQAGAWLVGPATATTWTYGDDPDTATSGGVISYYQVVTGDDGLPLTLSAQVCYQDGLDRTPYDPVITSVLERTTFTPTATTQES
ncbi:MAG TPA: hypothetical protein VGC67_09795 [Cellulomonas sp.]